MKKLSIVQFYSGALNHMGLYVVVNDELNGTLYHVVGSVLEGFTLNIKYNYYIFELVTYIKDSMNFQGYINDMDKFITIIYSIDPPPSQNINDRPHQNCQTWVYQVIEQLNQDNILIESQ